MGFDFVSFSTFGLAGSVAGALLVPDAGFDLLSTADDGLGVVIAAT